MALTSFSTEKKQHRNLEMTMATPLSHNRETNNTENNNYVENKVKMMADFRMAKTAKTIETDYKPTQSEQKGPGTSVSIMSLIRIGQHHQRNSNHGTKTFIKRERMKSYYWMPKIPETQKNELGMEMNEAIAHDMHVFGDKATNRYVKQMRATVKHDDMHMFGAEGATSSVRTDETNEDRLEIMEVNAKEEETETVDQDFLAYQKELEEETLDSELPIGTNNDKPEIKEVQDNIELNIIENNDSSGKTNHPQAQYMDSTGRKLDEDRNTICNDTTQWHAANQRTNTELSDNRNVNEIWQLHIPQSIRLLPIPIEYKEITSPSEEKFFTSTTYIDPEHLDDDMENKEESMDNVKETIEDTTDPHKHTLPTKSTTDVNTVTIETLDKLIAEYTQMEYTANRSKEKDDDTATTASMNSNENDLDYGTTWNENDWHHILHSSDGPTYSSTHRISQEISSTSSGTTCHRVG